MSATAKFATEWRRKFPFLKRYTPNALFLKADFMIIGLRISGIWYGGSYRIEFVTIPLWKENLHSIINCELRNKKGNQFTIDYQFHDYWFETAVQCAKDQFGNFLNEYISLTDFLFFLDRLPSTYSFLFNLNDKQVWFELRLAIALYFEDNKMKEAIIADIERDTCHWDEEHFFSCFNRTIGQWKEDLYREFADRDAFMERIKRNAALPKVAALNEAHIIYDLAPDSKFLRPAPRRGSIADFISRIFKRK